MIAWMWQKWGRGVLAISKIEVRGVGHELEVIKVAVLRAVSPSMTMLLGAPEENIAISGCVLNVSHRRSCTETR